LPKTPVVALLRRDEEPIRFATENIRADDPVAWVKTSFNSNKGSSLVSEGVESEMTIERTLRLMAGSFVLLSLALGHWVNPYWLLFTAFVGLNLFQSGITNWCPAMTLLRKFGMSDTSCVHHG
jgi:hypothetical protein